MDALSLRVGPFSSQAELLSFASALDNAPGILHVEMTQGQLQEARFAVTAPSTEVLALAVEANSDHTIHVEVSGSTVIGRVALPEQRSAASHEALLPTRTRFRVFRTPSETSSLDDAPMRSTYLSPRSGHEHFPEMPAYREAIVDAPAATMVRDIPAVLVATAPTTPVAAAPVVPIAAAPVVTEAPVPAPVAAAPAPTATPLAPPTSTVTEIQVAELLSNARDTAAAVRMRVPEPQPIRRPAAPPPPAAHATEPAAKLDAASDDLAGEIMIIASPFHSFLALNEFQGALRALPGVRDTRVRRFYGGTLNLSVIYQDDVPFVDRLRAAGGAWQVTTTAPGRLEVTMSEAGSLAGVRER